MLSDRLQNQLTYQANQFLRRKREVVKKEKPNRITIKGHDCIDFSSNDYLGLQKHPVITEAFIQSANRYGVGSGASALISGYTEAHEVTEAAFSAWLGVDAILFTSGYCANIGVMSALLNRSETVLSDKYCHASLLDAVRLSRAKHYRYQHNDIEHLTFLAEKHAPDLIVSESVFSMEGCITPMPDLVRLAKQYHAGLLIDDAHGIGVLGNTGAGITEQFNLSQDDFSCLVLPLGKAFNAMGAIVAGQADVIDAIIQFSKQYRYTTALSPAVCHAIQASLQVIQTEAWRRQHLQANIQCFMGYAMEKGLSLLSRDETPIKPILLEDNVRAVSLQQYLLTKGFYVPAIRPPTVPKHKSRLRISLNSLHTEDQIVSLLDHIRTGLTSC